MKANANRATARLSKNGRYLIVEKDGQSAILNANLVRYLFDIPYTRKDGTYISHHQIFQMKQKAQTAYDQKASSNAG